MASFSIKKAGEVISSILSPEQSREFESIASFYTSWEKLTGSRLAAHSEPLDIRNGILLVKAEHPGWIQLLQIEQQKILEKVKNAFPELKITGISFRLDEPHVETQKKRKEESIKESEPEVKIEEKDLKKILNNVKDEEFKKVLESLASTIDKTG